MNFERGKRILAFILTAALCLNMNGMALYAQEYAPEEITEVTEEPVSSEQEASVSGEAVEISAVVEEAYAEEISSDEAVGAAAEYLKMDQTNKLIYTADKTAVICEADGKTQIKVAGTTVSYCDLTGTPLTTPPDDISEYTVAAGNPDTTEVSADIIMESGKIAGIYGSKAAAAGVGTLLIDIKGGIVSGNGICLVKDDGVITGNASIRIAAQAVVNKLNTVGGSCTQVTIYRSSPMEVTGDAKTSFVFHGESTSENTITKADVTNYIDFGTVSGADMTGSVSGNVKLCDELLISSNEVLAMKAGAITADGTGKIQNEGKFEAYRGAVLNNPQTMNISGNDILIKEAAFTVSPSIIAPEDNTASATASIAAGDLTAAGITGSAVRLVKHGTLSSNTSITVDTTTEAGKGEYSYQFSYSLPGDKISFAEDLVLYDTAGIEISEEDLPEDIDIEAGKLKLTYLRYVGKISVVLRLTRGGSVYATLNLPYGAFGQTLENLIFAETGGEPEIEGKSFSGWYVLDGGEEKSIYEEGFFISRDVKNLYAKWNTADKVQLAIRDFKDGTLVRKVAVYGDTYLSDEGSINYSRDFYNRIGTGVYKEQQASEEDEGIPYGSATKVTSVETVSDNAYVVYAKYEFEATTFNDEEDSDFSFTFKKKAQVIEPDGEPVVSFNYTGREIQPQVIVKNGNATLKENDDYTITYEDNILATGTTPEAKAVISGRGIYQGSVTLYFAILPVSIKKAEIGVVGSIPLDAGYDDGDIKLTYNGLTVDSADYEIVYFPKTRGDEEVAGRGTIRVYGTGVNFLENEKLYLTKSVNFIKTEGKTDISSGYTVDVIQPQYVYTGELIKPSAVVGNATTVLEEGKDYKLVYENNRNVGKDAVVYAVGCGNYYGKTEAGTFEITQRVMKRAQIKSLGSVTYTGNKIDNLKLRVTDGKNVLVEGVDYTVSFDSAVGNINVSTGTVKAKVYIEAVKSADGTYTGNYRGIKSATFKIKRRNINNNKAVKLYKDEYSWSYEYTGKEIRPVVGLSYGGVMLEEGKDYTVTYKNNIKSFMTTGKIASMTIKGKNNFTGSKTIMFFIF